MNTPKTERTSDFYMDAFTSSSNWGPGEFEKFAAEVGVKDDPEDFFGQRAWRVWDSMTEEQRAEFSSDFDYWLDS